VRCLSFAALMALFGASLLLPLANSPDFTNVLDSPDIANQLGCSTSSRGQTAVEKTGALATGSSACPTRSLAQMPIPGRGITSVFGWRLHPIFRRRIFHDGVDFSASAGDKVHCVLDGVVRSAGPCAGYGNAVFIYHPASQNTSMYAHLSRVNVKSGQKVEQGRVIGLAGSTGFSTGVHLHFGVQSAQGSWVDPLVFLKRVASYEMVAMRQRLDATRTGGTQSGALVSAGLPDAKSNPPG
jgi:murein DD-endopeptidase MepM/ murein hydrolase activator NlpD